MKKLTAHLQGKKKRTLRAICAVVALLTLCLLPIHQAWAKTYQILIISSGESPLYSEFINTLQSTVLAGTSTTVTFSTFYLKNPTSPTLLQEKVNTQDLLLTIGRRAMVAVAQLQNSPPIVASLIPKQSYEKHRRSLTRASKKTTAVYSSPQQISEQTGEVLHEILGSELRFPKEETHPENFEIAINKSIAISLGIPLLSTSEIKHELLSELRGKK